MDESNVSKSLDRIKIQLQEISEEHGLTEKEKTICHHLALGENAKVIAKKEGVTYETVRWYRKIIYQKIGVQKQTELMRLFLL